MRLVLYSGKGGVGKTTTAAATAVCAAERGQRTLVVSTDSAHSLGDVLEQRVGSAPVSVAPGLDALEVDARVEMARHWGSIRDYLVALFRYQGIEEVVAEELALMPGAEELTALLAVEEHGTVGGYDLVVVDCAPSDSALRMLTLPELAHGAMRLLLHVQRALSAVATPLARGIVPLPLPDSGVFRDLEQLIYRKLRLLRRRVCSRDTSVRIVVTPERMVIEEARRFFTNLCLFDVACDAIVMNRILPAEAASEDFFRDWGRLQGERLSEVKSLFAPLPVLTAPLQVDEVTGRERLRAHGADIFSEVEPHAMLARGARVRFSRSDSGYRAHLPLPGARPEELDVTKVDDELLVRAGGHRRSLKLPRRVAPLDIECARLDEGELVIDFGRERPAVLGGGS